MYGKQGRMPPEFALRRYSSNSSVTPLAMLGVDDVVRCLEDAESVFEAKFVPLPSLLLIPFVKFDMAGIVFAVSVTSFLGMASHH